MGRGVIRPSAEHRNIRFPLLSDFEPKGEVAKSYGAYRYTEGVCERALFVIDKGGVVFWSYLSPIAVNPGADGMRCVQQSFGCCW